MKRNSEWLFLPKAFLITAYPARATESFMRNWVFLSVGSNSTFKNGVV